MPRSRLTAVLALTVVAAPAVAAERVTHTEGVVFVDRDGVHAQSGRAELVLPDGALVHLDVYTDVQVDASGRLIVRQGRVAIRTASIAPWTRIGLPLAAARVAPGGAYMILTDPIRRHLLVSVSAGRAEIDGSQGSAVLGARERAIIFDGSGTPVPTTFTPERDDPFGQWSEARLARAALVTIPGPRDPHPGIASAPQPTAPSAYATGEGIYIGPGAYVGSGYYPAYPVAPGYGGHHRRDPYAPEKPRFSTPGRDSSPARFGPRGLDIPVIPPSPPAAPSRHAPPRPELPPLVIAPPSPPSPPPPVVGGQTRGMSVSRPGVVVTPATPPPSPGRREPR